MDQWQKLIQLLEKYNRDPQYVAECIYLHVANDFYDLLKSSTPELDQEDEKLMDELIQFLNEQRGNFTSLPISKRRKNLC